MIELAIHMKDLLNPEFYIQHGGVWLFLFIVFAETGLFAGFFLPGDSLLFVAGIYSNELASEIINLNNDLLNMLLVCVLVIFAGILGNIVGYWFGAASGHLFTAKEFYEKHGGGAIVFARFLPIIRTFAPIIAGVVRMDKHRFTLYNIIGSVAWVLTMMFSGHYLYKFFLNQFGFDLKSRLEFIVLGIILVTTAPVIIKLISKKK
jgi:membrane-associated protein